MKKAIITGSTGLVGSAVARYLCSKEIQLLCLGRKNLRPEHISKQFGSDVLYISLSMNQIASLPLEAQARGWELDENTVFYNFAWSGKKSLADGSYGDQLINATSAAEAVKIAKIMKCSKFINSGSMEESFIEAYLSGGDRKAYDSNQTYYGLAKLASRDMCTMISYLDAIDYIHTRMSVPLAADLSNGGYVSSTLRKIFENENYDPPVSNSLFDIVLLGDVARAYYLIGMKGRNKANYYIGTGKQRQLRQYFEDFRKLCNGRLEEEGQAGHISKLFDVQTLRRELGFIASQGFEQVLTALRGQ